MIIKTKFFCKGDMSIGQDVIFIKGRWYDGECEDWSGFRDPSEMFRLNGGYNRYWAINEQNERIEMSKATMNIVFDFKKKELRDMKINEILK